MIKPGDRIPTFTIKRLVDGAQADVSTDAYFAGKRVVMFTVPGAFTGVCSKIHLPGYVEQASALKAKGVDDVICLAVNDSLVMGAWADKAGATGKVTMLADGNALVTRALGLDYDASAGGMGAVRCRRAALVVKDGVVESIEVEDKNPEVTVSGAAACLARLG